MMRAALAATCFTLALGMLVVKLRASVADLRMRAAGTLWTTRLGRRTYVASKVTMPSVWLGALAGAALLGAPAFLAGLLWAGFAVTCLVTVAALVHHRRVYVREHRMLQ